MRDPVALDFETCCFAPAWMAPTPVCASSYHPRDGLRLWATADLPATLERVLDEDAPILGHGFAYDACCWLEWFPEQRHKLWAKYENDGVLDSIQTERIIEISTGLRGKLSLDMLCARYGIQLQKDQRVRKDFGRYYQEPLSVYNERHRAYVGGDATKLYDLHRRQRARGIAQVADICDLGRADFWLRLVSNYGIRTDPTRVDALEASTQADVDVLTWAAQQWGAVATKLTPKQEREGKWYSRRMSVIKARLLEAYGPEHVPRTDSWDPEDPRAQTDPLWAISTARAGLDESGDPMLEEIAGLAELLAVRNKDVKMLKLGVHQPIHPRYGIAATTRTTCSGPNMQNFRRKAGIRECLMPRPGCVFVETDYPSLELFAVAQVCAWKLGLRNFAAEMNSGRDPHSVLTAKFLNTTYEDILARKGKDDRVDAARIAAKNGTYGMLGYMTDPETFAFYVRQNTRSESNPRGVQWTKEQAQRAMNDWRRHAGDLNQFLRYVDTLKNQIGLYDVEIPGTTIMRRGCLRTAAANTHFQGLGAKIARTAGWKMAKLQYVTRTMPSRTVLFPHDAFVGECKEDDRDVVAAMQEECMSEAMSEVCPDMRIVPQYRAEGRKDCMIVDSACGRHYSKNLKHWVDTQGRLGICDV